MRVGEAAALAREPVEVRRLRVLRAVAAEVAVADVVGEDEDDIRPIDRYGRCGNENDRDETEHGTEF